VAAAPEVVKMVPEVETMVPEVATERAMAQRRRGRSLGTWSWRSCRAQIPRRRG